MASKLFDNGFGYFAEDGNEYVITRPDTPRPWVNVISNGLHGLIISQAGGGYSWHVHATLNRLTRWGQDLVRDDWGKYLYLRDNATGEYWSVTWQPVRRPPERYECRHGMGYTIISSVNEGIKASVSFFVPPDAPLEIWLVKLKNLSRSCRELSLFSYFEWLLGVAPDWHREFHRNFAETSFRAPLGGIVATKRLWDLPGTHWNRAWDYIAFHTATPFPNGFDCDKEAFLGLYGSTTSPRAVREGVTRQSAGKWVDPIGCLRVDVELEAGEEREIVFLLGAAKDTQAVEQLVAKYSDIAAAKAAFLEVRSFWHRLLSPLRVETPDEAFNLMNNWWLKYQAISGRLWGRAGYYQPGGAYGFRDQLQDSQVFLILGRADLTLEQIRLHARHQFQDGTVYHWWHPLSENGLVTGHSDDLLWLPFVLINYLKETADFSALDLIEPYADEGEGTLNEHCMRAIDQVLQKLSSRGLPLIGKGDWNDGLNAVGQGMKGESIWLGHFLHWILVEYGRLAARQGDRETSARYLAQAASLKGAINQHAWDGKWYIRATDDAGNVLGSRRCAEGKIFLNAQTWAVISEVATSKRAQTAMDSVEQLLEREYGPLLLWPAYSRANQQIGYLTRYAPGTRENGGVYTHAATWAILAECMLKRADVAYRMYCKINPALRAAEPQLYQAEPYVTPGNVDGPDSPHFGQGGWTWYTGSAAWLLKVSIEGILGVRPTYEGLVIDPCIPPGWEGFKLRRPFRGAIYEITVENPNRSGRGVQKVVVDGAAVDSNVIPPFSDGQAHTVRVTLGKEPGSRS